MERVVSQSQITILIRCNVNKNLHNIQNISEL